MPARRNKFGVDHPDLVAEWHPTKNDFGPFDITASSAKRVWWVCPLGHEYESVAYSRDRGHGCPVCAGLVVLPGFNDLATVEPEIAAEWHPTKNETTPQDWTRGNSKVSFWWLGKCGHEWTAEITHRTVMRHGCPVCSGFRVIEGQNDLAHLRPDLASEWHPSKNDLSPSQVTLGSDRPVWWLGRCGHEWRATIASRTKGRGCRRCNSASRSSGESSLLGFIKSLGVSFDENCRTALDIGLELDMYLPEHNVGIEYNGLYWHSEAKVGRDYHRLKTESALRAGMQLIHVWEDDWTSRRRVAERMILRKLGLSNEGRVGARRLSVGIEETAIARAFLDENHIQGFSSGGRYFSLRNESGVVAIMCVKSRASGQHEIVRYATSAIVQGGFTKLLRFAEKSLQVRQWVTFADRGVSDGGLYEASGFVNDGLIATDYMYVVKGKRCHKFGYRKSRFRDDPGLKFDPTMTERQLADLNKMPRVWDAGKVRYVKNVPLVDY